MTLKVLKKRLKKYLFIISRALLLCTSKQNIMMVELDFSCLSNNYLTQGIV